MLSTAEIECLEAGLDLEQIPLSEACSDFFKSGVKFLGNSISKKSLKATGTILLYDLIAFS